MLEQRGHLLVLAVLGVALMLTLGLAVLSRVSVELKLSRQALHYERAWQAAMAGLEACMGYIRWDPAGREAMHSPATGQIVCSLTHTDEAGDSYTTVAQAANARQVTVESAGTSGELTRNLGAVLQYTLASGRGLHAWGGGNMKFAGGGVLDGDIFSAADIEVTGSFTVCGNLYAYGTAYRGSRVSDGPGCNVGFHSRYPLITFPDFRVPDLKARASLVIAGDHTPKCPADEPAARGPDCDGPAGGEQVVLVRGNLLLEQYKIDGKGTPYKSLLYTGRTIYVVEGNVSIGLEQINLASEAMLQVIADGPGRVIKLTSSGTIRGIYVAPEGRFETPGTVTLYGLVFASLWENSGTLKWYADPQQGVCTGEECTSARLALVKLWEE